MSSEFEDFTRAAAAQTTHAVRPDHVAFSRVAVLGGGPDARLLAALSLAAGCEVTLFSAYGAELELLRTSSGISLRGAGPIGTYHVDRSDGPSVALTAELDAAVQGAEVIFLTGPIHKQRTYAMVLANHLSDGQVLVIAPGRSLGAVETAWNLRLGGCTAEVVLAEVQGLPYWFQAEGAVLHLSEAGSMTAATLPAGRHDIVQGLSKILPNIAADTSVLSSSFADLSGAVEIVALALGGAGLESGGVHVPMGGTPLPENDTFVALLGTEQRCLLSCLAEERRNVARAYGVRTLPDTDVWIAQFAGAERGPGTRPVPDPQTARGLMRDGIIGSLAPLSSAAQLAGLAVPQTDATMTLTGALLGADVAVAGRRLQSMGITAQDADTSRQIIDQLTPGGR